MNQKLNNSFKQLRVFTGISCMLAGLLFSSSSSAVPPGWKIDNARTNPQYRSYVKRFKEAVLYSRGVSDGSPSYVFWGQFTRRTGEAYDEDDIHRYYFGAVIPCFSKDLLKTDEDERVVIECDQRIESEDGESDPVFRHYVGIYKNAEYSGFIVIGDGVTYKDIVNLGSDPNPSRVTDPEKEEKRKKKGDALSNMPH